MKAFGLIVLPILFVTECAHGQQPQQPKRIAIYPFQDTATSAHQQIGLKLYDRLVSRITDSGTYQVVDRQFLEQVVNEQRLPKGLFDDATAVKLGKLLNVSMSLFGTITTFTVNQNASEDSTGFYGTVTVGATGRLISTETGAIIKAPTANETARGMVRLKPPPPPAARPCTFVMGHQICGPTPTPPARPQVELKTLEQLMDEAIEACGRSLATGVTVTSGAQISSPIAASSATTAITVIGLSEGLTFINKGSSSGLKVGQVFQVYRIIKTGLTNPDDGTPVTRKNQICTLTLSDVEDRNSSGACAGGSPASGDIVEIRSQ